MAFLYRCLRLCQYALGVSLILCMLHSFLVVRLPSFDEASRLPMRQYLNKTDEPVKIAHVISLIVCEKSQRVKGFLDALAILRHSIHQNSVHTGRSAYGYQMFAIVHEKSSCTNHVELLGRLGYQVLLRDTPVNVSAIPNSWYRKHVENENCCGSAEFIKLYAYTLTDYPVVVHWDLDTAVLKPMDDVFDSMLFSKESERGQTARLRLRLQNPSFQTLPDRIDAFFTRDVTSSKPWEQVRAVQGGFLVARPNQEHFALFQNFISQGDYKPGRGPTSGWGGLGYGGFQGAMAYQGVLAYFYDHVNPGYSVELDVCRWNQVTADVIWRGPEQIELDGHCRQYPVSGVTQNQNTPENGQCEDCRVLPLEETMTVHFTACKKPWDCVLPHPRIPGRNMKAHTYRLQQLTNITTCGRLFKEYFSFRRDIESLLERAFGKTISRPQDSFSPEVFLGYCAKKREYQPLVIPPEATMKEIYGF